MLQKSQEIRSFRMYKTTADPPFNWISYKTCYLNLRDCSSLVRLKFGDNKCKLSSLIVLHLSGCTKLESTPDFLGLLNLEYLDLEQCTSLVHMHNSIWALEKLRSLSLRDNINLKGGPNGIACMTSLHTLDFQGSSNLSELRLVISRRYTTLGKSIPSQVLEALSFLDLGFCNLSKVPDDIGELKGLERLNLQGNSFTSLPYTIGRLSRLAYLNLEQCFNLHSLPQLPFFNDPLGGRYFKTVSGSRNQANKKIKIRK
ncbi:disease resistance protein TAO1-like [Arachis ipaensis]|uniref:disease resistance protein TAO1-like n=1 Tax=Arachis ipaensis TaxID=130454 RepID=UPI000A2B83A9|nr:disease resistance protein TAO1-like [Arachis ipaensis]